MRTDGRPGAGGTAAFPADTARDSKGDGISSHPATTEHRNDTGSSSERLVTKTCGPRQPCPFHKHSAVPRKRFAICRTRRSAARTATESRACVFAAA